MPDNDSTQQTECASTVLAIAYSDLRDILLEKRAARVWLNTESVKRHGKCKEIITTMLTVLDMFITAVA